MYQTNSLAPLWAKDTKGFSQISLFWMEKCQNILYVDSFLDLKSPILWLLCKLPSKLSLLPEKEIQKIINFWHLLILLEYKQTSISYEL